jgi:hypothetical protein
VKETLLSEEERVLVSGGDQTVVDLQGVNKRDETD